MLKVKNNNIAFAKGESVCLEFQIVMNNGVPFIMPPLDNNIGILALTVRSGISDDIVLAKYLDLTSTPIYSGYMDITPNGYCKFLSQKPLEFGTIDQMYSEYGYYPGPNGVNTNETPSQSELSNRNYIAYCLQTGYYYCYVNISETDGRVVIYTFEFELPIFPDETKLLDTKEYVYDLCAYLGERKDYIQDNEFPLKNIQWKLQLLGQHKLILEDSNNA